MDSPVGSVGSDLRRQNEELRARLAGEAADHRRRLDAYRRAQQGQAALVSRLQSKVKPQNKNGETLIHPSSIEFHSKSINEDSYCSNYFITHRKFTKMIPLPDASFAGCVTNFSQFYITLLHFYSLLYFAVSNVTSVTVYVNQKSSLI